ncbi:MAG: lysophospholipid acyltransferase family protein [Planctomycetota bacterium]
MTRDTTREPEHTGAAVPRISSTIRRWFLWYARRYVRKHFHAVRLSRVTPVPALDDDTPAIVYSNHPSWWDPMIGAVLVAEHLRHRNHYAPMDEAALVKYRFFSKLGFFGVQPDSRRGAVQLLKVGARVLGQPRATLWLTPQGRFVDVRRRPVELRPGLGHLVRRVARVTVVPLALEYTFWNEPAPEAFCRFGRPIDVDGDDGRSPADWTTIFEEHLRAVQDELSCDVMARRGEAFSTLVGGAHGIGGFYDLWRRIKAWLHGRRFNPEHDGEP